MFAQLLPRGAAPLPTLQYSLTYQMKMVFLYLLVSLVSVKWQSMTQVLVSFDDTERNVKELHCMLIGVVMYAHIAHYSK